MRHEREESNGARHTSGFKWASIYRADLRVICLGGAIPVPVYAGPFPTPTCLYDCLALMFNEGWTLGTKAFCNDHVYAKAL